MSVVKKIMKNALLTWAKTGRASGYLYNIVDSYGGYLAEKEELKKILGGINIACRLDDHVQQKIYFFGAYEPIETHLIMSFLKPGMTMFDLGANIGYYSLIASQIIGDQGTVHSFEPIPKNFKTLHQNILRNGFESIAKINNCALWHEEDQLEFSLPIEEKDNCGTFSAGQVQEKAESYLCQAITLDSYVEKNNIKSIDFMKIDIEGAELHALKGGLESIKKFQPTILIEIRDDMFERFDYSGRDIFELLQPMGYRAWMPGNSSTSGQDLNNLDGVNMANIILYTGELPKNLLRPWQLKDLKQKFQKLAA